MRIALAALLAGSLGSSLLCRSESPEYLPPPFHSWLDDASQQLGGTTAPALSLAEIGLSPDGTLSQEDYDRL